MRSRENRCRTSYEYIFPPHDAASIPLYLFDIYRYIEARRQYAHSLSIAERLHGLMIFFTGGCRWPLLARALPLQPWFSGIFAHWFIIGIYGLLLAALGVSTSMPTTAKKREFGCCGILASNMVRLSKLPTADAFHHTILSIFFHKSGMPWRIRAITATHHRLWHAGRLMTYCSGRLL